MTKKRVSLKDRLDKPITNAVSAFTTKIDTNNDTDNDTKYKSKIDSNITTKNDSKNVSKSDSKNKSLSESFNVSKLDTNNDTKNVTNITKTKSINLGNTTFKSNYKNDDKLKRLAYNLREDTIEKINKCSKISKIKKAELVDLILNSVLTDILNKIQK